MASPPTNYHEDLNLKPSSLLTPILVVEKEWHSSGVKLKMMRFNSHHLPWETVLLEMVVKRKKKTFPF
jgi:hypothetical protein